MPRRQRFNNNDEFLASGFSRYNRYKGGGGSSGPSVQEQDWLAQRDAQRQRDLIRFERQLAEDEARRQREEAEEAARIAAEQEAAEAAARVEAQEAAAQNATDMKLAEGFNSNSSLSYRDVSLQAFQRGGLIPEPDQGEERPE